MGKNVAVFVDVANIFYAAKAAGVDIDYVTLLKSATAGRDFVRAYAYTGLDPDNENQRNFHQFLARNQYKVVSKDIRKYGDGKVKANLDIELVVDLMKTARNLDVAVIVSGDGDFASAIRAVQEMGVRVEVDQLPRQHVLRPHRGRRPVHRHHPHREGRQGVHPVRTARRGRRRGPVDDRGPREAVRGNRPWTRPWSRPGRPLRARRGAGRGAQLARAQRGSGRPMGGAGLVALPGEKLSRAAVTAGEAVDVEEPEELEEGVLLDGEAAEGEGEGDGRRRRRRRGGRGRGRGRRDELTGAEVAEGGMAEVEGEIVEAIEAAAEDSDGADAEVEPAAAAAPAPSRSDRGRAARTPSGDYATPFDDIEALAQPRAPRSTPFGSVWDQQLGAPARPAAGGLAPLPDDEEDLDEPEIPEYLLAERRGQGNRGGGNRGGGGRGGRNAAYAAAIERERYGGGRSGGGSGINRYGETRGGSSGAGSSGGSGGSRSGGGNRGGSQPSRGPRQDRPAERFDRAPRGGTSAEPWSEVPPELEQQLLAQMARSAPAGQPSAPVTEAPAQEATPKRRTTRKPAAATPDASEAAPPRPSPRRPPRPRSAGRRASRPRQRRRPRPPRSSPRRPPRPRSARPGRRLRLPARPRPLPPSPSPRRPPRPRSAGRRASPRRTTDASVAAPAEAVAEEAPAAPKRRTTRKPAAASEG